MTLTGYKVGDEVIVTEEKQGNKGLVKEKRKGRVIQVYDRFVVVDNGKYRECVWIKRDELARTTIVRARRAKGEN